MSVTSLGRVPSRVPHIKDGDPSAKAVSDYLATLAKFIPGDVLALFVSIGQLIRTGYRINPKIPDLAVPPDWARELTKEAFIACLIFTPLWVIAVRFIDSKGSGKPFIWPIWAAIAGALAFAAYAYGIDTVWLNPPTLPQQIAVRAAIMVAFSAVVLTIINRLVGAIWPNQQV